MLAADDPALMEFLIGKGANVNAQDDAGETALMKAVASYGKGKISRRQRRGYQCRKQKRRVGPDPGREKIQNGDGRRAA